MDQPGAPTSNPPTAPSTADARTPNGINALLEKDEEKEQSEGDVVRAAHTSEEDSEPDAEDSADGEDERHFARRRRRPSSTSVVTTNNTGAPLPPRSANGARRPILPPTAQPSSSDALERADCVKNGASSLKDNASTSELLSASIVQPKRPRILPPPRDPNADGDSDDASHSEAENLGAPVIRFQTRRRRMESGQMISAAAAHGASKRARFLVRVNHGEASSRSVSPVRQVYVDRGITLDHTAAAQFGRRKCRDFEVLGYCLAGNNCPYAHGPNTIVIDDSVGLVPATTTNANATCYAPNSTVPGAALQFAPKPTTRRRTCSLLVRKIPADCANIAKINEYFSRFGDIKHIQVAFAGRADTALVSYAHVDAATRAFRCKEPIFANRFVQIRWHDDAADGGQPHDAHAVAPSFGKFATTPSAPPAGAPPPPNASAASATMTSAELLLQSAKAARCATALRPLSKRFATRGAQSLELKVEQERLLGAKLDLYLKLSEHARDVLLSARRAADGAARRRRLQAVGELQANMAELATSVRQLYASVHPGRAPLDLAAILIGGKNNGNSNGNNNDNSTTAAQQ